MLRALHFVTNCSSPNCLFLQKGQCLRGGSDGVKIKEDSEFNFFFFWCVEFVLSVLKAWFTIYKAVFICGF